MSKTNEIVLPVTIGLSSISNDKKDSLSTANLEIKIKLAGKVAKSLYHSGEYAIIAKNVQYSQQNLSCDCEFAVKEHQLKVHNTQVDLSDHNKKQCQCSPFKIAIIRNQNQLSLQIQKKIVNFSLIIVPKPKFVKNQRLQKIIASNEEDWGMLSMDKSQRILIEEKMTNFPIIGIWINSNFPLSNSQNLVKLVNHIEESYANKCKFVHNKKKYFYLVRINRDKSIPELFLTEWNVEKPALRTVLICKKDAFTKNEIQISSGQQQSLEFTLRSDQKVPQKLMNIECSPIQFSNDYTSSFEDTHLKNHHPNSPRFKLLQSSISQQQCLSLKRLVKQQEIEINQLRTEVLRLNSKLRNCSKYYCCQDDCKSSGKFGSCNDKDYCSVGKRLTHSDLNIQVLSTNNSSMPQTNESNESDGLTKKEIGQSIDENIWDRYQIIEK